MPMKCFQPMQIKKFLQLELLIRMQFRNNFLIKWLRRLNWVRIYQFFYIVLESKVVITFSVVPLLNELHQELIIDVLESLFYQLNSLNKANFLLGRTNLI